MDEDLPKPKKEIIVGADLSLLSVKELEERIAALEAEIVRIKVDIEGKQGARSAADAIFKS